MIYLLISLIVPVYLAVGFCVSLMDAFDGDETGITVFLWLVSLAVLIVISTGEWLDKRRYQCRNALKLKAQSRAARRKAIAADPLLSAVDKARNNP